MKWVNSKIKTKAAANAEILKSNKKIKNLQEVHGNVDEILKHIDLAMKEGAIPESRLELVALKRERLAEYKRMTNAIQTDVKYWRDLVKAKANKMK